MRVFQQNSSSKPLMLTARAQPLAFASLMLATAAAVATPAFAISTPSAPDMTDASDSGVSFTDNITKVQQPTFNGTGTPFNVVTLYASQTAIGTGVVNPSGQWVVGANSKLGDGPWTITAKQTSGGVISAASTGLKITVDTVIPYVSVPDLTPASDTGNYNSDNLTNMVNPTFQGVGSPGASVLLFNTTVSTNYTVGSATVSASGSWNSKVTAFPSGSHTYQMAAQAVDLAGNSSALTPTLSVGIDTNIPANPAPPDLTSDSGSSATDNLTNVALPSLAVSGEANGKIELWRITNVVVQIGTVILDGNGKGKITSAVALPDGYYTCYSKSFDRAGNQASQISSYIVVQIDTTPPGAANKPVLAAGSDTNVAGDDVTSINTPVVGGYFFEPNSSNNAPRLKIDYFAGVFPYTAKAQVSANTQLWSITSPTLPNGIYQVTATNTDAAGNSSVSPALTLTIDNSPPAVTLTTPAAGASISKLSTISGTLTDFTSGPQQVIYTLIRDSDGLYWDGTAWGAGFAPQTTILTGTNWTRTSGLPSGANLPLGSYTLTVAGGDKAGNSKTLNSTLTVVVPETVKPFATIDTPVLNQKILISDFVSSTVSGTATDNVAVASVKVRLSRKRNGVNTYWNGSAFVTASSTVDATVTGTSNATWVWGAQLPPAASLDSGLYQVDVYSVDTADNKSVTVSRPFTLGTDFTVPDVLIGTPTANQSLAISAFTTGVLTGTATDNLGVAAVKVKLYRNRNGVTTYWDGTAFVPAAALVDASVTTVGDVSVTWNFTQVPTSADLDAGVYSVTATAFDGAGNIKASVVRNFKLTSPVGPITSGSGGSS